MGVIDPMDMVFEHPIIHLPVCPPSMEGHSMGLFSEQAGEGFHGVVAVEEYLVVAEGSVVGSGSMHGGPRWNLGDQPF